eukprot:1145100-Pelagomonas_calceolata.AAC.1
MYVAAVLVRGASHACGTAGALSLPLALSCFLSGWLLNPPCMHSMWLVGSSDFGVTWASSFSTVTVYSQVLSAPGLYGSCVLHACHSCSWWASQIRASTWGAATSGTPLTRRSKGCVRKQALIIQASWVLQTCNGHDRACGRDYQDNPDNIKNTADKDGIQFEHFFNTEHRKVQ